MRWAIDGREEIDTLLVFVRYIAMLEGHAIPDAFAVQASLYSATPTASDVQSYAYLQPSLPDPTLATLRQISLQLNSFITSPPVINSTSTASIVTNDPTLGADSWVAVSNALSFLALVISLASAFFGIMVKRWPQEYRGCCSSISSGIARLRRYRLNNLEECCISAIVGILSVLLQLTLALLFEGFLVLLWHLH